MVKQNGHERHCFEFESRQVLIGFLILSINEQSKKQTHSFSETDFFLFENFNAIKWKISWSSSDSTQKKRHPQQRVNFFPPNLG